MNDLFEKHREKLAVFVLILIPVVMMATSAGADVGQEGSSRAVGYTRGVLYTGQLGADHQRVVVGLVDIDRRYPTPLAWDLVGPGDDVTEHPGERGVEGGELTKRIPVHKRHVVTS